MADDNFISKPGSEKCATLNSHEKMVPQPPAVFQENHETRCRNTEDQIQRILANLGLADRGYLVPYDLRILCQHLGLNGLSSQELAALFNHLDNDGDGKISVQDFLNAYPVNNNNSHSNNSDSTVENCSNVTHLVTDPSHNGALADILHCERTNASRRGSNSANRSFGSFFKDGLASSLFNSLDVDNAGCVSVIDLVRHWKCNNVVDCFEVLHTLRIQPHSEAKVRLDVLRTAFNALVAEKCDANADFSSVIQITMAEMFSLNESLLENREQISYFTKEVQQLNQRNGLLVDELEQNHQNLEIKSQQQLRDLEEKYQSRIGSLEQKYKSEREQWYEEIKDRDEMIHKAQQNESSSHYRHRQLERENFKHKSEIDDLMMTLRELEGANSELRSTLDDVYAVRKKQNFPDESQRSIFVNSACGPQTSTPRNIKIFENSKKGKRKRDGPVLTPILLKRSIRKQKLLLDESSEFESDPTDYMFDRMKCKRPLKKKQRLALIAHRLQSPLHFYESPCSSSNESLLFSGGRDKSDKTSLLSLRFNDCCSVINTHLSSLEKHLTDDYKFWIRQLRVDVADLEANFESEKHLIREEYEKRIDRMTSQFAEEKLRLTECVESDLRKKFEQEKRDIEIRFASERNIIERRFAEEKMKIMERLQVTVCAKSAFHVEAANNTEKQFVQRHDFLKDEFDTELKRVKNSKCCFNNSHIAGAKNASENAAQKQKIDKLVQEQTKLQNRILCLVDELNFVRTRLNAEEREKSNLKVYAEQLKRDFASKYSNDRKMIKETVDQMNNDIVLLTNDMNNLRQENELLKSKFVDQECKLTQTDDQVVEVVELISFRDDEETGSANQSTKSTFQRLQGVHSDDQNLIPRRKLNKIFALPLSATESACEAESYFNNQLPRTELSLVNFADQASRENLLLLQRLNEYRRLNDELTAKLAEEKNENMDLRQKIKQLHNSLERFQRSDYDSIKLRRLRRPWLDYIVP